MLDIILEYRKGFLFIRLSGKITKDTSNKYNEEVIKIIKNIGITNVVINLEKIYYIDYKGINLLYYTYEIVKENNGVLMFSNINKLTENILLKSHILKYIKKIDNELECLKI